MDWSTLLCRRDESPGTCTEDMKLDVANHQIRLRDSDDPWTPLRVGGDFIMTNYWYGFGNYENFTPNWIRDSGSIAADSYILVLESCVLELSSQRTIKSCALQLNIVLLESIISIGLGIWTDRTKYNHS